MLQCNALHVNVRMQAVPGIVRKHKSRFRMSLSVGHAPNGPHTHRSYETFYNALRVSAVPGVNVS